jgi:ribosomal protein S18 acetylase RimI-like enzyme
MPLSDKTVAVLSMENLDGATETMSRAFRDDPLWRYVFPNTEERQKAQARFFHAILTLSISKQQSYGIGTPPVGVAVWNFPGQPRVPLSFTAIVRLGQLAFSPFAIAAFQVRRIFAQFERMRKSYAPEPHYYLQTIGIRPDFQGQGLASRLIHPFLEKADANGTNSYTETMTLSNVSLYEHFGFKCVEQYTVPKTQLRIWALYRTAHKCTPHSFR